MHVVVRRYKGSSQLADELERKHESVEALIGGVPGFIAYYAVRTADGLETITVCQDKAGTDESIRRAAEWVRENIPAGTASPPEISEGDTVVGFAR